MGNASLNEISSLINDQIEMQEKLGSHLFKLEALLRLVTSIETLQEQPLSVLHGYFSVMEDMVMAIIQLNEACLSCLLKQ